MPDATLNVGTGTALGTLTLVSSGTIETGTIADSGSGLAFAGGTLSGVTYDGTMNLSPNGSSVIVTNGLTMAGFGGTGAGIINLTGQSSILYAEGTETLNNATLNIGNNSTDYIYNDDYNAAAVLTFGPTLTIDQTGSNANLSGYEDRSGSGIVNEGTINADFNGGTFTIGDVSFTNAGTINVSNGDTVDINSTSWSNTGSIDVSGGTLNLGSTFTFAQLGTLNHTGGVVNVTGTLNDADATLNVGTGTALGTLTLVSGGTIETGTIADSGSGLAFAGGTLSGVTYDGTMDLSSNSSSVIVTNGLTMAGLGGTGAGIINLTGQSSILYAEGTETLNNATLNIGNNSTDYIYNYDYNAAAVLTLGPTLTIDQTGSNANLSGYYDRSGSGIVNEGTINADFNGGTFTIGDVSFTNAGTINVSNGDTVDINSTSWSNTGSIDVSGGTLNLGSTFTFAQLGTLNHTGGIVNVTGTLNDADATLNVGTGTALGTLTLVSGGTIETGTIADSGSGLAFTGGTLSGVAYDGTMNLSSNSSSVTVTNGLTMAGFGGTGAGIINLTGQSSILYAEGTETLNNATLNIGNNSTDYIYNDDYNAAAVLTFGPTLTIDQTGSNANLSGYEDRSGSGIVNEGTINADFNGGTFTIGDVSFTNAGTINVSNGDTVDINSTSWSNTGSIDVSGGTLNLGSTFTFAQLGTLNHTGGVVNVTGTLNDADATLNVGTGTALGTLTLVSSGTIETGTIADSGSGLAFAGGTLSGVTYDGTMDLSPNSSSVTVTNGLTMAGFGGTGAGIINLTGQSSILYAEGTETLNNATLNIGNNSTDYIYNDDYSAAAVLTFGPTLTIDQTGSNANLSGYEDRSGSGIVNEGTINADFNGGTFTIGDVSFTNTGTINVSNGDTVDINSTSWSNTGSIDVSGGTLNLGSTFTFAQLGTLNHTGGVVNVTGTLNDADATLNVGTGTALGTLTLVSSGTIETGTIADSGSGLAFAGGTLSGVTYDGTMDLSPNGSSVTVTNGLTMAGLGGTGAGIINLTGQSSILYAEGTETLNNATLNIGNNSTDYIYNYDYNAAAVLTFGPTLTIDQTGSKANLSGYEDRSGSGIVNEGTINADFNGGTFTIGDVSFTNTGTINVSNGDTVDINSTSWSNTGSIDVSGGTLNLGSTFTFAQLGTLNHTGGVVNVTGTLNDADATLNVGTGTALGTLTLVSSGTIETGTIADSGSGLAFAGGTLSGVTYDGTMDLSPNSSSVTVTNGLTMAGLGGTGAGIINLTGQSSILYAEGTETLNNATLNIGNNSTDYIYNYDYNAAAVLTLGPTLTIDQTGSKANLSGYEDRSGSGIVNEGTINADFNGGTFTIGDVSFTNTGTINVSNGDTVDINSTSFINSGTLIVNGGTLNVTVAVTGSGSATISGDGTVDLQGTDAQTVTFSGAGGTLEVVTPTSFSGEIEGITGTDDILDLKGYDASTTASTTGGYNSTNNTTLLTITDPGHATLHYTLAGNLSASTWTVAPDGSGSGVDIVDPPATSPGSTGNSSVTFNCVSDTFSYEASATAPQNAALAAKEAASVSIGGAGYDNFIFHLAVGADTIADINPPRNTVELDHFADAQTIQQLASVISTYVHSDAVIEFGHTGSIAIPGVTQSYLQAHFHSLASLS